MTKVFENKTDNGTEFKKLGLVERKLRVSRNLTIEQTAKALNISKGNLCEIESGKRRLKKETFLMFITLFSPTFDFSESLVEEAEAKLDELVTALLYRNREREDLIENWMIKNRNRLLNSFACLYLIVFETYFYYRRSISHSEAEILKSSEDFIQYFSPDIRAFLLFNKGYKYKKLGMSSQAIELFEMAIHEMNGKRWPQLKGVIQHNLAGVIALDVSFQQAFDLADEAETLFLKGANFPRVISCYNNKANFLCLMGQYDRASSYSDKIILNKDTFKDMSTYNLAVSNRIMIETLKGDFKKALQFISVHKDEIDPRQPRNFILEPYCLLQTRNEKECLKSIRLYKDYNIGEDDEVFYSLIRAVISKKADRVEKAKSKMFRVCHRMKNWGMMLVMFQAVTIYYKENCQNDRLVKLYELQTSFYKHQIPSILEMD